MPRLRVLVEIASWMVTAIAAAAVLTVVALITIPRLMNWQAVVVLSGSMEPTLKVGGIVILEPVDPGSVKAGDIVSYREPNSESLRTRRVTHRVVEVVGSGETLAFKTKGDANEDPDPYEVPAADVISREVWSAPYLGRVARFISSRQGFYLLIAIPGAFLIVAEVSNIFKELRKMREERKAA